MFMSLCFIRLCFVLVAWTTHAKPLIKWLPQSKKKRFVFLGSLMLVLVSNGTFGRNFKGTLYIGT